MKLFYDDEKRRGTCSSCHRGLGCVSIGAPIPAQPDPSKIVGVFTNGPQPEPDYPPVPDPGFYWAKLQHDDGSWTVVEVTECTKLNGQTLRHVEAIGSDGGGCGPIAEWGPKLEPPR